MLNNAFAITATGGWVVQQVTGVFHRHGGTATGILNLYGNLGPGHTNCSAGQLTWTAGRQ